ncbi:MAG: DsbE family thiol:disulfide interchange protein [Alphaproteobacteria bacterium]|nr:MAG: DsbE family thiol:disulfide interchange protein [Alphaproteobacteria bacterium]
MKRLVYLLPLVGFLLLGWFLWRGLSLDPHAIPSARVGKPVPAFALASLDPTRPALTSGDLATGRPLLVNFFASWCPPCHVEHPLLMKLRDEGIVIIGIAYKDVPADTRHFLRRLGNPFTQVGIDQEGRTAIDFGVSGVPETFVINGRGRIVLHHPGPLTEAAIADEIRPALARAVHKAGVNQKGGE